MNEPEPIDCVVCARPGQLRLEEPVPWMLHSTGTEASVCVLPPRDRVHPARDAAGRLRAASGKWMS